MMTKTPSEYLKAPYQWILIPEDNGGYSAEILEFPGCFADGESADQAIRNLRNAAVAWIEAVIEQGDEIPEPSVNWDFGGKFVLRLPRSIHRQASRMAARDNVSLNTFLLAAIAARVGAEDLWTRLAQKLEGRLVATAANLMVLAASQLQQYRPEAPTALSAVPMNIETAANVANAKEITTHG